MDFIRVHLLGTSPLVTPDRYQTATAVETPEGIALIDAAEPADGEYRLLFGSDDGMRLWIDDEEVYCLSAEKGTWPDETEKIVSLKKGTHRVLIANEQRYGSWMFYFRIVPR